MFHSAKTSCSSSASEAETSFEQLVGFADQLHVAVLNAVVDHLDVVAGAVFADPIAAGRAVFNFGGNGLENLLDMGPRCRISAGHDGGAEARAFFAAGNAGADEENALVGQVLRAAVGVGECELPPSMMMSPFSRCGRSWSIVWSTASPALTISMTRARDA